MEKTKYDYIKTFSQIVQDDVNVKLYHKFKDEGMNEKEIRDNIVIALDSRLIDLQDVLDISKYV